MMEWEERGLFSLTSEGASSTCLYRGIRRREEGLHLYTLRAYPTNHHGTYPLWVNKNCLGYPEVLITPWKI